MRRMSFGKPMTESKIPMQIVINRVVREKGRFTGKTENVKVANPAYNAGFLDNAVFIGAHRGAEWRGMNAARRPSEKGNTYVGRQRSGRIKRTFGPSGYVSRAKASAAMFSLATERRQDQLIQRAKTMSTGESNEVGSEYRNEMLRRMQAGLEG